MKRFWMVAMLSWVAWVAMLSVPAAAQQALEDEVEKTDTRVFDVRDLILPMPDYDTPTFSLQNVTSVGRSGTGVGSVFGDVDDEDDRQPAGREESLNDLVDLIRQVVAPGTWDEGSGNAIRGRRGSIIMTHRPTVLEQAKKLLDEIRLSTRTRMVSVHVRFVKPKAEDMQRILERGLIMARTDLQKAELLKLAGETVAEVRILGMDGQQVGTVASTQSNFIRDILLETSIPKEKDAEPVVGIDPEIGTIQDGIMARVRPVVVDGKVVVLDFKADLARMSMSVLKDKIADTRVRLADWPIQLPVVRLLVFRGMYRIPDGAVLLTSGGTLFEQDPMGIYALIRVDVVDPGEAPEKQ